MVVSDKAVSMEDFSGTIAGMVIYLGHVQLNLNTNIPNKKVSEKKTTEKMDWGHSTGDISTISHPSNKPL